MDGHRIPLRSDDRDNAYLYPILWISRNRGSPLDLTRALSQRISPQFFVDKLLDMEMADTQEVAAMGQGNVSRRLDYPPGAIYSFWKFQRSFGTPISCNVVPITSGTPP